jgi:hypothetical protein
VLRTLVTKYYDELGFRVQATHRSTEILQRNLLESWKTDKIIGQYYNASQIYRSFRCDPGRSRRWLVVRGRDGLTCSTLADNDDGGDVN